LPFLEHSIQGRGRATSRDTSPEMVAVTFKNKTEMLYTGKGREAYIEITFPRITLIMRH
jgi:hypothetical protein